MSSTFPEILRLAGALSLLLTPGLLVLLALPTKFLPGRDILPAAFALSPAVLAFEVAVSALAGMPFSLFVPAAVVANAIAAALAAWIRPARVTLGFPVAWILPAALVIAPIAAVLAVEPMRRVYGFHNLMQIAAILEIFALPRPPEDINLAGVRLDYGWLGWAQVAAIAQLADVSPTLVFGPLNIMHLVLVFYFVFEAAAIYCGGRKAMIGIAASFALLSPGLLDMVIRSEVWSHPRPFGEHRISPFHSKFLNMDLMAYSMPLMALMSYSFARAIRSRDVPAAVLMCISAGAASLVYPLFLPSCVVIIGGFLLFALLAPRYSSWSFPRYSQMEVSAIAVVCAASLVAPVAYISFMSRDAATPAVWLNLLELHKRVIHLGVVFCVIDGLLIWIARDAWRSRDGATLLVITIAVVLQAAFVLLGVPDHVQYKILFAALILIAPVLAAWITAWAEHDGVRCVAVGAAFVIAAVGSTLATTSWVWHDPAIAADAEILDESTVVPHPIAGWSESWRRAVRERTPPDAVLLTGASNKAEAVFVNRALYVCDGPSRDGYSMTCERELEGVKRYSRAEIARRKAVLDRALAAELTADDAAELMNALAPLGRPIALHTRSPSAFRTWLETNGIGRSIFASDTDNVWLIDRAASSMASR